MSVSTMHKASKTIKQAGFVNHYVLIVAGLIVIAVAAWFTYQRVHTKSQSNTGLTTSVVPVSTANDGADTSSEQAAKPLKLKIVNIDSPKVEIQVPEDWVVSKGGDYTFIKGSDTKSGLQAQIGLTTNNYQPVGCTIVDADSQLLVYDNPTSVQRKHTNLTYLNIADDITCTMVITGAKSYKKGDFLDNKPSSSPSEKSLPTDLITVSISKIESSTNFPKHADLLKSDLHSQIIGALESIRIN
jgi:hypothetical protein